MSATQTTRRTATDADLTVGATVYKGKGATAYVIVTTRIGFQGETRVGTVKVGSKVPAKVPACIPASMLTVSE